MQFSDLALAVIGDRFDPGKNAEARRWLVDRYARIWVAADWPVRHTATVAVTVTARNGAVTIPGGTLSAFVDAAQLFDEYGQPIPYMDPDEFYASYQEDAAFNTPGPVQAWTIATTGSAGTQIVLGPTPDHSATFTLAGWQGPVHRTTTQPSTFFAGTLSADTDLPWFPDDHDETLISWAQALGLKRRNDPTWQPLEQDALDGVAAMRETLLPRMHAPVQFGRVAWGE